MAQPVVLTQPSVQQIVIVQPQGGQWQTGLCDCCTDCGVCFCGAFCYPCLGCQVAADMNECSCCGSTMAMRDRSVVTFALSCGVLFFLFARFVCPFPFLIAATRDAV